MFEQEKKTNIFNNTLSIYCLQLSQRSDRSSDPIFPSVWRCLCLKAVTAGLAGDGIFSALAAAGQLGGETHVDTALMVTRRAQSHPGLPRKSLCHPWWCIRSSKGRLEAAVAPAV